MVKVDDLSKEIARQVALYTEDVKKKINKAQLKVARDTVEYIRHKSPIRTGSYYEGWDVKKVGNARIVYNRTDYQLTHLLEYGHAKKGGGRVAGKVHIRPAEEQAVKDFTELVEKAVKG